MKKMFICNRARKCKLQFLDGGGIVRKAVCAHASPHERSPWCDDECEEANLQCAYTKHIPKCIDISKLREANKLALMVMQL